MKTKSVSPVRIMFPMKNPPIVGADISRYQAMIVTGKPTVHFNFEDFQAKGGRFLCIRSVVAAAGLDYEVDYNAETANRLGIPFMLYGFIKLWHNLATQIRDCSKVITEYSALEYFKGFALDIESNDGLSKTTFTGNAQKVVKGIQNTVGFDPNIGIYTRAYFWNANTYRNDWAKTCWLWVAHWFPGINPYVAPTVRPYIPNDWGALNNPITPVLWQFDTHDSGFAWGSRGDDEIDLNFFTAAGGTEEAFNKYFG